eukprot:TRINITY_DN13472_c0_g1_i1.p1 TRINITY_DN13472_c0_g1~~TRINITY_DN13472_c0_g1_i1.p1  ORF type:complete len:179 (+),score=30.58 TRINITY_DN13472_c0_g1_i1:261-797(+)
MKRITWYPQAWLGLAFNWGILLGYAAVTGTLPLSIMPLYMAGITWTLVYDTIYAHMDKSDDLFIGVRSTAIKFAEHNRPILAGLSTVCILSFLSAGFLNGLPFPYYMGVGLGAAQLIWQVSTVKFENSEDCMRKFISNKWFGAFIFSGILASNLLVLWRQQQDQHTDEIKNTEKKINK